MHLTNWKAKRAGGRITVYGTNPATGIADKIVGVDEIRPWGNKIVAIDKDGKRHELRAA